MQVSIPNWRDRAPAPWGRFVPSFIALLTFCFFAWLLGAHPVVYRDALQSIDGIPNPQPFADLRAILLAGSCWRQGVNVYMHNPCMGGGVYNYSPFLLRGVYLGLGPQQTVTGGVLLGLAFIAALALLPPPRTNAALVLRSLAAISPGVFNAVESANFDVAVFILTLCGILLLNRNKIWVFFGYAVFAFAAALKFYPLALMALALRETFVRFCAVTVATSAALVVFLFYYAGGTAAAIRILPGNLPFSGAFGAITIPLGIGFLAILPTHTLTPVYAEYHGAVMAHPGVAAFIYIGTHALWVFAILAIVTARRRYAESLETLPPATQTYLLAGMIMIIFCFFAAQNFPYRDIFLLFTLPGLSGLAETAPHPRRFHTLTIGVLLLMWEAVPRMLFDNLSGWFPDFTASFYMGVGFWFLRELLWWWVIIQFGALILQFTLTRLRHFATGLIDPAGNISLSSEHASQPDR